MNEPTTLVEAIRYFSDPDVCLEFMVNIRWPDGVVVCPTCGRTDARFIPTRRVWECKSKHDRRQFSVKVGTIFEDSPLGLDKWLAAIWMIANDKNGVSSYEIHRAIGVTQSASPKRPLGSCSIESAWRCKTATSVGCPVRLRLTKLSSAAKPVTCTSPNGKR